MDTLPPATTAASATAAAASIAVADAAHGQQRPPRVPGIATIKPEFVIRPLGGGRGPSKRDAQAPTAGTQGAQSAAAAPASGADYSDRLDSKRTFSDALGGDAAIADDGVDEDDADDAAEAAGAGDARGGGRRQRRGQNKGRKFAKTVDEVRICNAFLHGRCAFGKQCRYSHDVEAFLRLKQRDITFLPRPSSSGALQDLTPEQQSTYLDQHYTTSAPFVKSASSAAERDDDSNDHTTSAPTLELGSIDTSVRCPIYDTFGECQAGWKCRFLGGHVKVHSGAAENGHATDVQDSKSDASIARIGAVELVGFPLYGEHANGDGPQDHDDQGQGEDDDKRRGELNYVKKSTLRKLKSRKYPLPKTTRILEILDAESEGRRPLGQPINLDSETSTTTSKQLSADMEDELLNGTASSSHDTQQDGASVAVDKARIRPTEKRRLDWKGKLYLAPLTTTGNLPFRRLCLTFGSDIHCGEMGLAESYLNGSGAEWSLVRRWEGERIFGTQICGSKPQLLVPAVEALVNEVGSGLDFVDLNCGCPIDLVYSRGAGSALLDHANKLGKILRGVNAVLGEIPLTIKLRTGTTSKNTTHKLFARLQTEWGVSAATLHGRSRKQRYKNLADWDYIKTCADTLRESVRAWNEESRHADEPEMVPVPIFGNGDVYSWEDYRDNMERSGVDGQMAARGALIKPWLFTEIKEQRTWDISSRERLDMYRQYAEYAISHWGSDTQGVNIARRYFCEALSFTHRYVPAGILEYLPPRLNDRPPIFKGRDELETLLASSSANDWVKISNMFFGRAPDSWHFTPKHKSNSYGTDAGAEQQG